MPNPSICSRAAVLDSQEILTIPLFSQQHTVRPGAQLDPRTDVFSPRVRQICRLATDRGGEEIREIGFRLGRRDPSKNKNWKTAPRGLSAA